jgi:hypothetical protein
MIHLQLSRRTACYVNQPDAAHARCEQGTEARRCGQNHLDWLTLTYRVMAMNSSSKLTQHPLLRECMRGGERRRGARQ